MAKQNMFKNIRAEYTSPATTLYDDLTKNHTSNIKQMQDCIHRAWSSILDMHVGRSSRI